MSTDLSVKKTFAVSIGKMNLASLCTGVFLCQIYQTSQEGSPNDTKSIFRFPENKAISDSKKMARGNVTENHLRQILEAGIRVPDHGALKPWKLRVIRGAKQKQLDETVIFAEFIKANPDASAETQSIEKKKNTSDMAHKFLPRFYGL